MCHLVTQVHVLKWYNVIIQKQFFKSPLKEFLVQKVAKKASSNSNFEKTLLSFYFMKQLKLSTYHIIWNFSDFFRNRS